LITKPETPHNPRVSVYFTQRQNVFPASGARNPSARLDFADFDRTERVSVKFTAEAPAARLFQAGPRNRVSV
jgi:hypothetical protein